MKSLKLLAVIVLTATSTCTSAFVSTIHQPKTIDVNYNSYPSTRVSLQHINCNKRIGNPRSSRSSIDCRSSSSLSTSLVAIPQAVATSISGFYKASPLLAGVIVGLVSHLTRYSSRVSRKDTKLLSLNNKIRNNSNFTIRTLCSGLVLSILFEIMIHGSIIFSL